MADASLEVPQPNTFQRWLLLSSMRLIRRFRRPTGSCLMLTKDLCVKYGWRLDIVEAQTMMYVAKHTSIPVPKVYFAFTHKGFTYIFMERIHGQMAGKGWIGRPQPSKSKVLESLRKMILELRTLSPPSSAIASVTGGSLYDPRLPSDPEQFGPFKDVKEFHDHLRNGIRSHKYDDVQKLIDLHHQDWEGPRFTHGDLSSFNILVRGDEVVGIVD